MSPATVKTIAVVANTGWFLMNSKKPLLSELTNRGWEVLIVCPKDQYIDQLEGESVRHIEVMNLSRRGMGLHENIRLLFELHRIYKKYRPDVILHFTIKPNIWGSLAAGKRIPSISVLPGLGWAFGRGWSTRALVLVLYRLSLRRNVAVVFENQGDLNYFISKGVISKEQGYNTNGCGVDLEELQPSSQGFRYTFLFAGRLIVEKGIIEYIEAASQVHKAHPKWTFGIAGGPDKGNPNSLSENELQEQLANKPFLEYIGFVNDLPSVLNHSKCVVMPSYYHEGVPRVLLESLALAKPLITTNQKGCRITVNDGVNGFLVASGDVQSLADAMIRVGTMPDEDLAEMGKHGRHRAEEMFDIKRVNRLYVELVERSVDPVIVFEA